jgi:hypothetical protein
MNQLRPTPEDMRRYAAYDGMTKQLRAELPQIEQLLEHVRTGNLTAAFDLGDIIRMVHDERNQYGWRDIEYLARFLEMSSQWFYDLAFWTGRITGAQREYFCTLRQPDGGSLSREHVAALALIPDYKRRCIWAERAAAEGLTARQLLDGAKEAGDASCRPRRGRGRAVSPEKMLKELPKLRLKTDQTIQRLKHFVLDEVDQMPPDSISMLLRQDLEDAEKVILQMHELLVEAVRRLDRNISRVDEVLGSRGRKSNPQEDGA